MSSIMTNGWFDRTWGFTNMNSRAEHHRWRRSVYSVVRPTIIAERPVWRYQDRLHGTSACKVSLCRLWWWADGLGRCHVQGTFLCDPALTPLRSHWL